MIRRRRSGASGFQTRRMKKATRLRTGCVVWLMRTILFIVLIILLLGALPAWPYSTGWGYYPSGGFGVILVIVLILFLMGKV